MNESVNPARTIVEDILDPDILKVYQQATDRSTTDFTNTLLLQVLRELKALNRHNRS